MKKKDVKQQKLADKLKARKDTGVDKSPHLMVIARAGTGKTTTLVEGLRVVQGETSQLTPSPQQKAVWDAMALSRGRVQSICFVAFNKAIADELASRVPDGCNAMTMHSMGNRAVQKAFGKPDHWIKLNGYRVQDIISELEGRDIRWLRKHEPELLTATERLVGLCKMNLILSGPLSYHEEQDQQLAELASYYDVDLNGSAERVFKLVPQVLERCKDITRDGCMDFNDMIWLPVALDLNVYRYDLLLVDEAQDLNRCQQALAMKAGRRLILCGDPRQAIYGFAGADADSMPRMQKVLEATDRGCTILPLTVTRRCSKAVVNDAKELVPDFEAHESNGDGKVSRSRLAADQSSADCKRCDGVGRAIPNRKRDEEEDGLAACGACEGTGKTLCGSYTNQVTDGDMILCRTNAPLISECFKFLAQERKANIRGRDIGQGLVRTVEKLMKGYYGPSQAALQAADDYEGRHGTGQTPEPPTDHEVVELQRRLDDWLASEQRKEQAKRNPSDARLIGLQDRYDCLCVFCEGQSTVSQVIHRINNVFENDNSQGIHLSSVHKAKGLEARRVFILLPENGGMPHPMAKSKWQRDQEWNLKYVAITRAIEELVYVT